MDNTCFNTESINKTITQLTKALEVLQSTPIQEWATSDDDILDWVEYMKLRLERAGVDFETLQRLPTSTKIISIKADENGIATEFETEDGRQDGGAKAEDYIALFQWILADRPKSKTDEKKIPSVRTRRVERIEIALPAVNHRIFNLNEIESNLPGALGEEHVQVNTAKRGKKGKGAGEDDVYIEICMTWADSTDGFKITRPLDIYDKWVYTAINALYQAKQTTVTPAMIYHTMGRNSDIGRDNYERIWDSVRRMSYAHVVIDNTKEIEHGYKYEPCEWRDFPLLSVDLSVSRLNGKIVPTITILNEPRLFTFARERRQITSIPRKVLESSQINTEENLRIRDYLIRRIVQWKGGAKGNRKALYKTIADECGITSIKQKQRLPDKVKRFMSDFKDAGWIKGFTCTKDGVEWTDRPRK